MCEIHGNNCRPTSQCFLQVTLLSSSSSCLLVRDFCPYEYVLQVSCHQMFHKTIKFDLAHHSSMKLIFFNSNIGCQSFPTVAFCFTESCLLVRDFCPISMCSKCHFTRCFTRPLNSILHIIARRNCVSSTPT